MQISCFVANMLSYHKTTFIFMVYVYLWQKFVVAIYALFPPISLAWKVDSANFFTFRMYDPSGFSVNAEVQIKISLSSLTRARRALGSRSRRSWASLGKNLYSTGSSLHTELKIFTLPWKRSFCERSLHFLENDLFVKDLRLFSTSTSMIRLNLFFGEQF